MFFVTSGAHRHDRGLECGYAILSDHIRPSSPPPTTPGFPAIAPVYALMQVPQVNDTEPKNSNALETSAGTGDMYDTYSTLLSARRKDDIKSGKFAVLVSRIRVHESTPHNFSQSKLRLHVIVRFRCNGLQSGHCCKGRTFGVVPWKLNKLSS